MSAATAFNPLSAAHDMEAIGIDRAHAATLAKLMHLAATANDPVTLEKLATKDDMNVLKDDMNALKVEVRSLEARMYRALWIQGGAIVGILTALRFLPI